MIKTDRLVIHPASEAEMVLFIAGIEDEGLRGAYQEMLDGCLENPQQWEWYAIWMIEFKDGTHIGETCFKGITEKGCVEIGYGIAADYRGCGYATEAVTALAEWALVQSGVMCVMAETEESNIASRKVLGKAGFVPTGESGEEGPIYLLKRKTYGN